MHLFSYLYIVAVLIPLQQIKVMKLKVYLQLQTQAIPSPFPTGTFLETGMIPIQDLNGIITGTGTTGDTTTIGDLITGGGTSLITFGVIIIGIAVHLLDRYINRKQGFELTDLEDQDQNQE